MQFYQDFDRKLLQTIRKLKNKTTLFIRDEEKIKAIEMSMIYEDIFSRYIHNPTYKFIKKSTSESTKQRHLTCFLKAAKIAEENNVSYQTYIEAQFYYLHQWLHRPPRPSELISSTSGFDSRKRLREYLKLSKLQRNQDISSPVISRPAISKKDLEKINMKRLKELQKTWNMGEIEIFTNFSHSGMFDIEWLNKQAAYQSLKEGGIL